MADVRADSEGVRMNWAPDVAAWIRSNKGAPRHRYAIDNLWASTIAECAREASLRYARVPAKHWTMENALAVAKGRAAHQALQRILLNIYGEKALEVEVWGVRDKIVAKADLVWSGNIGSRHVQDIKTVNSWVFSRTVNPNYFPHRALWQLFTTMGVHGAETGSLVFVDWDKFFKTAAWGPKVYPIKTTKPVRMTDDHWGRVLMRRDDLLKAAREGLILGCEASGSDSEIRKICDFPEWCERDPAGVFPAEMLDEYKGGDEDGEPGSV